MQHWVPQSFIALRHYNRHTFISDAIAGVTVGLVALPLAMAFAIASGLSPQAGIYCAIVAGFLTSALGGSMTAIGGPTGAFVVVVAGIVSQYGVDGLFLCTMMAGMILVVLGASGVGSAVKYIPRPVVVGFTNGIAVLIASTQLKDFFGLRIDACPTTSSSACSVIAAHFSHDLAGRPPRSASRPLAIVVLTPRVPQAGAGHHRRDVRRVARRDRAGAAGRDDRHPVRRRSVGPSRIFSSRRFHLGPAAGPARRLP